MLVVEARVGSKHGRALWRFRCDCGNAVERVGDFLKRHRRHSCGCLNGYWWKGKQSFNYKHGGADTAPYTVWCGIKQRCHNPNSRAYRNYGGRGIVVCDEWLESFEAFAAWSAANGYRAGLELDRIDNNGPYSPDNCRYVTKAENLKNRRSTRLVGLENGYDKAVETLRAWAEGFYSEGTAGILLAAATDLERHRDELLSQIYEPGLRGGRKAPTSPDTPPTN